MTQHCRTAVLLAGLAVVTLAAPSGADVAEEAAVVSFSLDAARGHQRVDLVASRGSDGDRLLVRVEDCLRTCSGTQQSFALPDGALVLGTETAELRTTLSGRVLRVTWALAGDGVSLRGLRLESDARTGSTTADTTAGQTADVRLVLDGAVCVAAGSIGRSVQVEEGTSDEVAALGKGALVCDGDS